MAQGNLGVLFNSLRGKAGSVVFSRSKDGTVVRPRVSSRNPRTPAQQLVRSALTKAAGSYKSLTAVNVAKWQAYATSVTKHDPRTGKTYNPSAIAIFVQFAAKYYQVTPAGTAPSTPPITSFNGDTVTCTAAGGAAKVAFTASAANTVGVTTELLLQPLKSQNRTPQPKGYRSKAFQVFVGAPPPVLNITVTPGWYVPAYRFVNTLTGQDTGLVILPAVQAT